MRRFRLERVFAAVVLLWLDCIAIALLVALVSLTLLLRTRSVGAGWSGQSRGRRSASAYPTDPPIVVRRK
jgi:hypothetical protein